MGTFVVIVGTLVHCLFFFALVSAQFYSKILETKPLLTRNNPTSFSSYLASYYASPVSVGANAFANKPLQKVFLSPSSSITEEYAAFAITADGELFSWGKNSDDFAGILCQGHTNDVSQPTPVNITGITMVSIYNHALLLSSNGLVYGCGVNVDYRLSQATALGSSLLLPTLLHPTLMNQIIEVSAGSVCSLALRADGRVFSFGSNIDGALLDDTLTLVSTPTLVNTTGFLRISSSVQYSIGFKTSAPAFQLLFGGSIGVSKHSTAFSSSQQIVSISAAANHILVVTTSGEVYTYGYGSFGRLGNGTLSNTFGFTMASALVPEKAVLAVGAPTHSVVVTASGSMYGFGSNHFGELPAAEDAPYYTTPVKLSPSFKVSLQNNYTIAASKYITMAISDSGQLWIWGKMSNIDGNNKNMTDYLPVTHKIAQKADQFSAGDSFALVLSNGTAYTFGLCSSMGISVCAANTVEFRAVPTSIGLDSVKAVSAGSSHGLLLHNNGSVFGFGASLGISGGPSLLPTPLASAIFAGYDSSFIVDSNGVTFAYGNNTYGQLCVGTTDYASVPIRLLLDADVRKISAGKAASLLLLKNRTLIGCGDSSLLGLGDTSLKLSPTYLLSDVLDISGQYSHYLVLLNNGTVLGLGSNIYKQIAATAIASYSVPIVMDAPNNAPYPVAVYAGKTNSHILYSDGYTKLFGSGVITSIPLGYSRVVSTEFTLLSLLDMCFSLPADSPQVCSSHGTCVGFNNCSCSDGWTGRNCGIVTCFGIASTDSSVCSYNGNCTNPNSCTCKQGYGGDQCQYSDCFGTFSNSTSVCSGHGSCVAPDFCKCSEGYHGAQCNTLGELRLLKTSSNTTTGYVGTPFNVTLSLSISNTTLVEQIRCSTTNKLHVYPTYWEMLADNTTSFTCEVNVPTVSSIDLALVLAETMTSNSVKIDFIESNLTAWTFPQQRIGILAEPFYVYFYTTAVLPTMSKLKVKSDKPSVTISAISYDNLHGNFSILSEFDSLVTLQLYYDGELVSSPLTVHFLPRIGIQSYTPTASLSNRSTEVTIFLKEPISNMDLKYFCHVGDLSIEARLITNAILTCNFTTPAVPQYLDVSVYASTPDLAASAQVSTLADKAFEVWSAFTNYYAGPDVWYYTANYTFTMEAMFFNVTPQLSPERIVCMTTNDLGHYVTFPVSIILVEAQWFINCQITDVIRQPVSEIYDVILGVPLDSDYLILVNSSVFMVANPLTLNSSHELVIDRDAANTTEYIVVTNVVVPDKAYGYEFKLRFDKMSSPDEYYLNCSAIPGHYVTCTIPDDSAGNVTPQSASVYLEIFKQSTLFRGYLYSKIHFIKRVDVETYPFIADASAGTVQVTFTPSNAQLRLYQTTFYFIQTQRENINETLFGTSFHQKIRTNVPVSYSDRNVLFTLRYKVYETYYDISRPTRMEVTNVTLTPNIADSSLNDTICLGIVDFVAGESLYSVPSQYRNLQYNIDLNNTKGLTAQYPCSVSIDGNICCRTEALRHMMTGYSIEALPASWSTGLGSLVQPFAPLVVFNKAEIAAVLPKACVRNTTVHVVIEMKNLTALQAADDISSLVKFSCHSAVAASSTIGSARPDQLSCILKSDDPVFGVYGNQVWWSVLLSYYGKSRTMSNEESMYLLDKGTLRFEPSDSQKFFFLPVDSTAVVTITLDTNFGDVNLTKNVECRSEQFHDPVARLVRASQTSVTVECTLSRPPTGSISVYLIYNELDYQASLSLNSLRIYVAQPTVIDRIEPVGARTNSTATISVFTQLDTSFGVPDGVFFFCNITGPAESFIVPAVVDTENQGAFLCEVFALKPQVAYLSLLVSERGRNLTLSEEPINIVFLDSFFLEPSYGIIQGGEQVQLKDYKESNTTMVLSAHPEYKFSCEKSGTTLNCVTPVLPLSFSFASYAVDLGGAVMSLKYVAFEKRTILSVQPAVFTTKKAIHNITVTVDLAAQVVEGQFSIWLGEAVASLGKSISSNSFTFTATDEKSVTAQLMYVSPYLFERRNSIRLSRNTWKMQFIQPRTTSFAASADMGYSGQRFNTTVILGGATLDDSVAQHVFCVLDSTVTPAVKTNNPNEFICTLFSTIPQVSALKLVYQHSDAENGQVELSQNSLKILFIPPTTITKVTPFVTLQNSQLVTMQLSAASSLSSEFKVYCRYQGSSNDVSLADLSSLSARCNLTKRQSHTVENVELWAFSNVTKNSIPLSSGSIPFAFSNKHTILSANPFIVQYDTVAGNRIRQNSTVFLDLPILLSRNLQCKYSTGVTISTVANQNRVTCTFEFSYSEITLLESVSLRLMIDNDETVLNLTSNAIALPLVPALKFNNTLLTDTTLQNLVLSYKLPQFNMTTAIYSATPEAEVTCTTAKGYNPSCSLVVFTQVVPLRIQLYLNVTYLGQYQELPISPLYYYEVLWFFYLNPMITTFSQLVYKPLVVDVEANKQISLGMNVSCSLQLGNGYQIKGVLETSVQSSTARGCRFEQLPSNVPLQEEFVRISLSYANQVIVNTPALLKIQQALYLQRAKGPHHGSLVLVQLPPISLLGDTSKYIFELSFSYQGSVFYQSCDREDFVLKCTSPDVRSIAVKKGFSYATVSLLIYYTAAFTFSNSFMYYESPVLTAYPSKFVEIGSEVFFDSSIPLYPFTTVSILYNDTVTNSSSISSCTRYARTAFVNTIRCPTPSTLSGWVTVALSLDGEPYVDASESIFLYKQTDISISPLLDNSMSIASPKTFSVVMTYNSTAMTHNTAHVKLQDMSGYSLTITAELTRSNALSSVVRFTVPALYDEQAMFPRTLSLFISVDNMASFIYSENVVEIQALEKAYISQSYGYVGTNRTLTLSYPTIAFKHDHVGLRMVMKNGNSVVRFDCIDSTCTSTSPLPAMQQIYTIGFCAVSVTGGCANVALESTSSFMVYQKPTVLSVSPKYSFTGKTTTISLQLQSGFIPPSGIVLRSATQRRSETAYIETFSSSSSDLSVSFQIPQSLPAGRYAIGILYESEFIEVSQIDVKPRIVVDEIQNPDDSNLPSAFSFRNTLVNMIGRIPADIVLEDVYFSLAFTYASRVFSAQELNATATTDKLTVSFPMLDTIIPDISLLRFPLEASLGISFDGGYNFEKHQLYYLLTYRRPEIYQIDLSIVPSDVPTIVTLRGLFSNVKSCVFITNERNFTTPATVSDSSYAASCNVTKELLDSKANITDLYLQNTIGELSNSIQLTIFKIPVIESFYPLRGPTQGGFTITMNVTNFDMNMMTRVQARLGSQITNCEVSSTFLVHGSLAASIVCNASPHEEGNAPIALTYNGKHFYAAATTFFYEGCAPGSSSSHYSQPCLQCPPGYYKPTAGSYECIPCLHGTYSESPGTITCKACPERSTTRNEASTSFSQCGCESGYMTNPSLDSKGLFCVDCVAGGNCSAFNTSIPPALSGYWHSVYEPFTYFQCIPATSCPGGDFNLCASGYTGERCGECSTGYYKTKTSCTQCASFPWERLVGLIIFLAFLAGLAILFLSVKFTHLGSISITLKLFQVVGLLSSYDINWPSAFHVVSSLSTASNFNFDFLSPQCLFPNIKYYQRFALSISTPFMIMAGLVLLYVLGIVRSLIASKLGYLITANYAAPLPPQKEYAPVYKNKFLSMLHKMTTSFGHFVVKRVGNALIYIRNFIIWCFKHPFTTKELSIFRNKLINMFFTYLTMAYIFIITTSAEIFACQRQSNGQFVMMSSPDLLCWTSPTWWILFGFTVVYCLIFIGGAGVFFLYIFSQHEKLKDDRNYQQRYRFLIKRYKRKYFFYEAIITLQKLVLSTLKIFFRTMMVVVFSILVQFVSLMLHLHFIPYKKKMHNIMEYVVSMSVLGILFLGLLILVDKLPTVGWKTAVIVLTIAIIVACITIVVSLTLWDINTRKKKEKLRKVKAAPTSPQAVQFSPLADMISSDEDKSKTINDVLSSMFSKARLKKKLTQGKKKVRKLTDKIRKKSAATTAPQTPTTPVQKREIAAMDSPVMFQSNIHEAI